MATYDFEMTEGVTKTLGLELFDGNNDRINALNHLSSSQTGTGTGNGVRAVVRRGNNSDADEAGMFSIPFVASDPTDRENSPARAASGILVLTAPDLPSGTYRYAIEGETASGVVELWLEGEIKVKEGVA